ncbi:SMP-30/gluconolactonase/LRE family protein [Phaeobacter sp. C3_T13_0]|uniref:SMP-30/gluconolactonase/LRE family protein n=1 Tax=Phaeobacter cretensis TaxID=3342641 RepID=UPI0039BD3C06
MKSILKLLSLLLLGLLAYLAFWPVAVSPVAWNAPKNSGYSGKFQPNDRLSELEFVDLDGRTGPEDADVGPDGLIYLAMHGGEILRIGQEGVIETFAATNGRPLGIEFGNDGTLFVADAYLGLLSIDQDGQVTLLANETEQGSPILYANDLDVAADGTIYFSDASTRFGAEESGGTLAASILDLVEHSANARVLKYAPSSRTTTVFADGLTFANGIAIDETNEALLVAETGEYRVWQFPLAGGPGKVILQDIPGFPDNLNHASDGTYWLGVVSPRNLIMDKLSGSPFFRRVVMRLPEALKPAPTRYGFILRFNAQGDVVETLQDPSGEFALTTGAISLANGQIAVTSLTEPRLGLLK